MREETGDSWAVMGTGVMTKRQAQRGTIGTLAIAAVGAVIGALLGIPALFGQPMLVRMLILAAVGAAGGAVVGFIAGAGTADEGPGSGGPPLRR